MKPRTMGSIVAATVVILLALTVATAHAATAGFLEDFPTGAGAWTGGSLLSNPNTGGVGGVGDGYLNVTNALIGKFGSYSQGAPYQGDWIAAGITAVKFYLNDVGAAQLFEIHLVLSDGLSIWQYNTGANPPNNAWQQYSVDVTSAVDWTRVSGTGAFTDTLHNVDKIHFRHDKAPYMLVPDAIVGELGIDNVTLATPSVATIADFKQASLGTVLTVAGKKVTGVFPGYFYIEEPNRVSGIRVASSALVSEGMAATVTGGTQSTDGELAIVASWVTASASPGLIASEGMPNRSLGGAQFGQQSGVMGAAGLNNVGLLVRIWGNVTQVGAGYIYVDDGSALSDGTLTGLTPNVGARVICNPTGHAPGDHVIVTGESSAFNTPALAVAKQVLTRTAGDIVTVP